MRLRALPVLLSTTLTCAALTSALASETHPLDLRVSLVATPGSDSVDVTYRVPAYQTGLTGQTADLQPGWRLEAGLVGRLTQLTPNLAVIGGAAFFYGDQSGKEYGDEGRDIRYQTGPMTMTTMGVDLSLALALSVTRYVDVEFGPFVGLGAARISDRRAAVGGPNARVEASGSGDYEEAGLSLALTCHNVARSLLIGLGIRYLAAYGEAEFAMDVVDEQGNPMPNGLQEEVEVRLHGFSPYLTLALSF